MAALLLAVHQRPASADWPPAGRAVCTAPANQTGPRLATDGGSGAIIVWDDSRSTKVNLFARRVLASGDPDPAWPVDGRPVLADSAALAGAFNGQQAGAIVPDGSGGAIVVWHEKRDLISEQDIYAQHLLPSGVVDPAWPPNGRAICAVAGAQVFPSVASDGAGGAIVAWTDIRVSLEEIDIYAQHVLASGVVDPAWPAGGVNLSDAPGQQATPEVVPDGSGGAIVAWSDFSQVSTGVDLFAQRVLGTGQVAPGWPAGGRVLTRAIRDQEDPNIASDGAGGVIAAWEDNRDQVFHIYAQRVLGTGQIAPGWPADGRLLCDAPVGQVEAVPVSDGAQGALVAWKDFRSGTANLYAQHVLAAGAIDPAWTGNGRALSLSDDNQEAPTSVDDGAGGAIVAWTEAGLIRAHHLLAGGQLDPAFPADGRVLRPTPTTQTTPEMIPAGPGNAIVAFADQPANEDPDIYAMIVATNGAVDAPAGTPSASVTFAAPAPNPAREELVLRYSLPRDAVVRISIYDAAGRRVRRIVEGMQPAGEHAARWDARGDGGTSVRAGVYFARLEVEGRTLTQKITRLE